MKLDLLSGFRRKKKVEPQDEIDRLAAVIEQFAPRDHRPARESFYYNYKSIGLYFKPLAALLRIIAERKQAGSDGRAFGTQMFLRLKEFYDPRGKLSEEEALADPGLRKKYAELFRFFYGEEGIPIPIQEVRAGLKGLSGS